MKDHHDMANEDNKQAPGLTDLEAMEATVAVKRLHALAEKTGETGLIRAMAALHENVRRYGEKHHPDVTTMGGST